MDHLVGYSVVHRDLGARNVLLSTGYVAKVADFGLSRRVKDTTGGGFYESHKDALFPAKWTAPEAMVSVFSSAALVLLYN